MTTRFRFPLVSTLLVLSLGLAAGLPAQEAETAAPAESELTTENDKMLYTLGLALAQQVGSFGLTPEELEIVGRGMADAVLKREPLVDLQTYGPKLQGFAQERMSAMAEVEKSKSADFQAAAKEQPGAETTASGLIYRQITAGSGASPQATDTVRVHYHGTLRDGTVFDSSRERDEPAQFALNRVIPCWTEGLQKMKVGGKSRLVCPAEIAYGDQGRPGIPGGATLDFEVELLAVVSADPAS